MTADVAQCSSWTIALKRGCNEQCSELLGPLKRRPIEFDNARSTSSSSQNVRPSDFPGSGVGGPSDDTGLFGLDVVKE